MRPWPRKGDEPEWWPRFIAKVDFDGPNGCWLWTARIEKSGYGRFGIRGWKWWLAHRLAYTVFVGEIPGGLELDHLCRVRHCVNPVHLEAVTHAENIRRGRSGAHHGDKTHCKWGHPFDESNTIWRKTGGRKCRACSREQDRRRRRRS